MTTNAAALEAKYGARNYAPLPVTLVRAKGADVWDADDKHYIDMLGAYSAVSHGHCHPRLVAALTDQAQRMDVISRAFQSDRLGLFLERACKMTGMARALPMNTGAEDTAAIDIPPGSGEPTAGTSISGGTPAVMPENVCVVAHHR